MNNSIGTRELITLQGLGALVRATYHPPHTKNSDAQLAAVNSKNLGILFLNSLSLPRAATGDSSVYWAEAFAECGYPSFRIDLPGLGDSEGSVPGDMLEYVNSGGYAAVTSTLIKEISDRFQLSGMVVMGHCAGAVSAIHAAAASKECKGLVLMDPYFHLNQAVRPKVRQELSVWARRNALGRFLSSIYDRLRDLLLTLHRNALPKNANIALLNRWKDVSATGLPILLLKAPGLRSPGTKPRVGEFDYLSHILGLASRKGKVMLQLVEGTDHSFANRVGRAAVRKFTSDWLDTVFPLADTGKLLTSNSSSKPGLNEQREQNPERVPTA